MTTASIFEAKTNLSKLINSLINKENNFIVIMKNGTPVAKIVPYENKNGVQIGLAKDILPALSSIDEFNSIDVEKDFYGNGGLI